MSSHNDPDPKGVAPDPGGCHYLPDTVAVRNEERDQAVEALLGGGFDARDDTEEMLRDSIGAETLEQYLGLEIVQGRHPVGLIRLAENPHRGAAYLAQVDHPIDAAPVHGLGFEGHAGFMSGAGPAPADDLADPDDVPVEGFVAVVDSGIAPEDQRPWWMSDAMVDNETIDIENTSTGEASHGTFVSSLIRKLAPDHRIAFAAARPDTGGALRSRHPETPSNPPTHELEILGAVIRLVIRFAHDASSIEALNLSLGAARCGRNDGFLLTLRRALDIWRDHFGYDAPILAAGGNSPSQSPVYPGAFSWVRAVGAAEDGGDQVVWRDGQQERAPARPWITDVAPGVMIHGLSGVSPSDTVWWSGSSFATAIATSQSVTGSTYEVASAETYWQDLAVDYGRISGLEHG